MYIFTETLNRDIAACEFKICQNDTMQDPVVGNRQTVQTQLRSGSPLFVDWSPFNSLSAYMMLFNGSSAL